MTAGFENRYAMWRKEIREMADAYEVPEKSIFDALKMLTYRRGDLDIKSLLEWREIYAFLEKVGQDNET
jgi:hypothetical protein